MTSETCQFCNKIINRSEGNYETRFCSDDCRFKFNNAQRKYKNKIAKLADLVDELVEAGALDNDLSAIALDTLRQMDGLVFNAMNQWKYKCAKCGRYDFKHHGNGSCPDCQGTVFGAIAPTTRPDYLNTDPIHFD